MVGTNSLSHEPLQVLELVERAHRIIDEFLAKRKDTPDRAWESVTELHELLDQLQSICPPRTFRRDIRAKLTAMHNQSASQQLEAPPEAPAFMTVSAVAQYLGTDRSVIYRLARSGEIPCSQFGATSFRFDREQIDSWRLEHDDLLPRRRR
ncbi:MAG TPA: helix-turn-helix domain-containing protein [Candidatus Binataceae bacterium]|nr:helix-turn-helix domain-containing protein [Candidatus Binataceae bacterium]